MYFSKLFKSSFVLILLSLCLMACQSLPTTKIPVIQISEDSTSYNFKVYLRLSDDEWDSYKTHKAETRWLKNDDNIIIEFSGLKNEPPLKSPVDIHISPNKAKLKVISHPTIRTDMTGISLHTKQDLLKLEFSLSKDRIIFNEPNPSGFLRVTINKIFSGLRTFAKIPNIRFSSHVPTIPINYLEYINNYYKKVRHPTLKLPVTVFFMGGINNFEEDYLKHEIINFLQYWGKCGIKLDVKKILLTQDPIYPTRLIGPFVLSPELYKLLHILNQNRTLAEGINLISGIRWTHPEKFFSMIDGAALSRWRKYIPEQYRPKAKYMAFVPRPGYNTRTWSHEIGHLMLQNGHHSSADNLMAEGATGSLISSEQCDSARELIKKEFSNYQ